MIRCQNCGTHMEEGSEKCPLCGEPQINSNTSTNTMGLFGQQGDESFFKSPSLNQSNQNNNQTFFPSQDNNNVNNNRTFFSNRGNNSSSNKTIFNVPSSDNNSKKSKTNLESKKIYLIAIIAIVFILIIGGFVFFSEKKDNTPKDETSNKIELSELPGEVELEKPTDPEEPTDPEDPDDPDDPEDPETPTEPTEPTEPENIVKFGDYKFEIPDGYSISTVNDSAVTLVNNATGYIITFEAGPYNIGAYRANDDSMKSSYESQNATVERIYDDNISSHDVHILEVDQNGTKFIIAITPSVNKRAYILTIFNGYQKDAYDYGALNEALLISDSIILAK